KVPLYNFVCCQAICQRAHVDIRDLVRVPIWNGEEKKFRNTSDAHMSVPLSYVRESFGMTSFETTFPYIIIWTYETLLDERSRPFMVVGLVAVWLVDG